MVLRTSVGYNTQKATLQLTEDQRKQADQFGAEAQKAGQAGQYGEAMRSYYHGIAAMHSVAWSPAVELASSLLAHVDHAMTEPGREITVTLTPLYPAKPGEPKMTAAISLAKKSVGDPIVVNPAALPCSAKITVPQLAPGDYQLEVRLAADGETAPAGSTAFLKSVNVHVEPVADAVAKLRARIAKGSSNPTAEYALTLYERADKGDTDPSKYNFRQEIANANAILDAVDAGRDPFASKRGDMRKAYRSTVDDTLQPYRLFIPDSYDPAKPIPLVVALHGMGREENSMFDDYRDGVLKTEAARVGFAVVCPKGRGTASMYRGDAERDVLDVLAQVEKDYRIDTKHVFLMGHSMGGYGTWSIAMAHPDLFAGLGPISGGGDPNGMVKIKGIPEFVTHGDNDRTVSVAQSRRMVEAAKQAGVKIEYHEIPGGSHVSVAAPAFGPMMDYFKNLINSR